MEPELEETQEEIEENVGEGEAENVQKPELRVSVISMSLEAVEVEGMCAETNERRGYEVSVASRKSASTCENGQKTEFAKIKRLLNGLNGAVGGVVEGKTSNWIEKSILWNWRLLGCTEKWLEPVNYRVASRICRSVVVPASGFSALECSQRAC